jgi:hypothetical protein
MENGHLQISPLARAYLAAVRAGEIAEDSPGLQLLDGAAYLLWRGIGGTSADVLRVMAALCEVAAELKEESHEIQSDSDSLREARQGASA